MAAAGAGVVGAAAAAAGINIGALLAGDDPAGEGINNLETELKDLKARKKAAAKELKSEKQKRDRLLTKAKSLSIQELGAVLGVKISAKVKADAKAKANAKAKAKAAAGPAAAAPAAAAPVEGEDEGEADEGERENGGR